MHSGSEFWFLMVYLVHGIIWSSTWLQFRAPTIYTLLNWIALFSFSLWGCDLPVCSKHYVRMTLRHMSMAQLCRSYLHRGENASLGNWSAWCLDVVQLPPAEPECPLHLVSSLWQISKVEMPTLHHCSLMSVSPILWSWCDLRPVIDHLSHAFTTCSLTTQAITLEACIYMHWVWIQQNWHLCTPNSVMHNLATIRLKCRGSTVWQLAVYLGLGICPVLCGRNCTEL